MKALHRYVNIVYWCEQLVVVHIVTITINLFVFLLRLYKETPTILVWTTEPWIQESALDIFVSILSTGMAGLV